jgi:hypothetical protein
LPPRGFTSGYLVFAVSRRIRISKHALKKDKALTAYWPAFAFPDNPTYHCGIISLQSEV